MPEPYTHQLTSTYTYGEKWLRAASRGHERERDRNGRREENGSRKVRGGGRVSLNVRRFIHDGGLSFIKSRDRVPRSVRQRTFFVRLFNGFLALARVKISPSSFRLAAVVHFPSVPYIVDPLYLLVDGSVGLRSLSGEVTLEVLSKSRSPKAELRSLPSKPLLFHTQCLFFKFSVFTRVLCRRPRIWITALLKKYNNIQMRECVARRWITTARAFVLWEISTMLPTEDGAVLNRTTTVGNRRTNHRTQDSKWVLPLPDLIASKYTLGMFLSPLNKRLFAVASVFSYYRTRFR